MTLTEQEWQELIQWINGGSIEQTDEEIEYLNLQSELEHNQ